MGWDYWMRTAFRKYDVECVIPEISRSHHAGSHGASVTHSSQVKLFKAMAFANIYNTCNLRSPCQQFGDVSYLLNGTYENWMHAVVSASTHLDRRSLQAGFGSELYLAGQECKNQAQNFGESASPDACAAHVFTDSSCGHQFMWSQNKEWGCRCCTQTGADGGGINPGWNLYTAKRDTLNKNLLNRDAIYVLPYRAEDYLEIVQQLGLRPPGTRKAIPEDIRAEHYGLLVGRDVTSRAQVVLVDRRSQRNYLKPELLFSRDTESLPLVAARGESCTQTCSLRGMHCDATQLYFLNNCRTMEQHFHCKWCAHQVGQELPVYVPDEKQPTFGQCLITFISPMRCETQHPSTQRLCACVPNH